MKDPPSIYRWLLRLYPARFREEYETPMERQFWDDYRDADGGVGRVGFWLRTFRDLAVFIPGEIVRELAGDLKHSVRVYRTRAFSTILAVVSLGLAIGTCTGVFSVLNALLLRGLPFARPAELVELSRGPVGALSGRTAFLEWQAGRSYLAGAATYSPSNMNLTGEREAVRVRVAETSANFFALMGARAVVGRTFSVDEDVPGHNGVAVVSHGLWRRMFGGDPGVIGAAVNLNGTPFTVIGVAPARF